MSYQKSVFTLASIVLFGVAVFAQEAKIPVRVSPPQAYVFLDGVAIGDGNLTLKTTAGEHTIQVYNYGFHGQVRKVTAQAGKNEPQTFALEKAGADVSSPYGYIQIEGPNRAAVLLNGTSPDYLVGHVDEFNNHIIWKQQLIVPVGTHQLMVTRDGKTLYQGPIEVAAGQRVIVNLYESKTRTQAVDSGSGATRPRFDAGTASAKVVIAPVSGSFASNPGGIDCNEVSKLAYSSVETLHSYIKNSGEVKEVPQFNGEVPVSPRQTTTYNFEASGPGGFVRQDATVTVNPVITSQLDATPGELHYLKIGDKILTQDSADLKWNVHNADNISLTDPVGKVAATVPGTTIGEQKVTPEPKPVTGPVDETMTYTITSSNVCGGSDTKTAQVRMKGMIEPYILSVFFPTGYPTRTKPEVGLVASQQDSLMKLAKAFPIYAEHTPDAKLVVHGYADPRGGDRYNLKLSERRIEAVKNFLVAQGVPADKITIEAFGDRQQLDKAAVNQLEAENPMKDAGEHNPRAMQLAYNRRIDVELLPVGIQSARFFPHQVNDAELLLKPTWPKMDVVMAAQQTATPTVTASAQQ